LIRTALNFLLCKKQILAPYLINIRRFKKKRIARKLWILLCKIWQAPYFINMEGGRKRKEEGG